MTDEYAIDGIAFGWPYYEKKPHLVNAGWHYIFHLHGGIKISVVPEIDNNPEHLQSEIMQAIKHNSSPRLPVLRNKWELAEIDLKDNIQDPTRHLSGRQVEEYINQVTGWVEGEDKRDYVYTPTKPKFRIKKPLTKKDRFSNLL